MTVQQDLEKAIAAAEAAQGTYLMFKESTEDSPVKEMYQAMAGDVTRHVGLLTDRLQYVNSANPLNQSQGKRGKHRHR